jgi:activator of 2-hydroxyglutaryl-CoA dehydratase
MKSALEEWKVPSDNRKDAPYCLDEMGERSLRSTQPVEFTTGCAVFAESEAVSRIAEGAKIDDIIAGVHRAMG